MQKYSTSEETLGYVTAADETNTDKRLLVRGSQNVLIDRNRKVKTRPGFTRIGAGNDTPTAIRNGFTWHNSSGGELPLRFYDDEWEVLLQEVDSVDVTDGWTRFSSSMDTEAITRGALWFDATENIDLMILVQGDDNLYEWNGAAAVILSTGANTLTKTGTKTWAQTRVYTTRDKVLINTRTGVEFTYTGGESSTTLTGVTPDPAASDVLPDDIFMQKIVTRTNAPIAGRNNHTIYSFENQICVGSSDTDTTYISKNTSYYDFSFSAPRLSGEGALLTLDGPPTAFGVLGTYLVIFAGRSSLFRANYEQITVGSTLAETLKIKKVNTGVDQAAVNQEVVVQLGNSLIYLSHEPAVRMISDPDNLAGSDPRTLSNPIKPDLDAEDTENACATWYRNAYYLSMPNTSRQYILEFVEDANGKLRRFWNPPQILPVRAWSTINNKLHGHSNAVPETYELFSGTSDILPNGVVGDPDSKIPSLKVAAYAYNLYGDRINLKTYNEYFSEGEITSNTDILLTLNNEFSGAGSMTERIIHGDDEDILEGNVGFNSLGQTSLGTNPLGGLLNPPDDARKFNVTFEYPREDIRMLQPIFSSNGIDEYWAIAAHGANVEMSRRRNITHRK